LIKCLECGDEFSYGRKITCCNSTYFGKIFNNIKKDYQWNCYKSMSIKVFNKSLVKEIPEIIVLDKGIAINYDWNCDPSLRIKIQKNMEEYDYILIYE
jgi:hypothetical protein